MAKTIKFKTNCQYCGKICEAGKGFLHRVVGAWKAHCFECHKKKESVG